MPKNILYIFRGSGQYHRRLSEHLISTAGTPEVLSVEPEQSINSVVSDPPFHKRRPVQF